MIFFFLSGILEDNGIEMGFGHSCQLSDYKKEGNYLASQPAGTKHLACRAIKSPSQGICPFLMVASTIS